VNDAIRSARRGEAPSETSAEGDPVENRHPNPTSVAMDDGGRPSVALAGPRVLDVALAAVEEGIGEAHVRGDHDQADRLKRLWCALEHEADYARHLRLGFEIVRRRTDAPPGATLGWWFRYDARTRELRLRRSLTVDCPAVA
jgi:hypothetical protein